MKDLKIEELSIINGGKSSIWAEPSTWGFFGDLLTATCSSIYGHSTWYCFSLNPTYLDMKINPQNYLKA